MANAKVLQTTESIRVDGTQFVGMIDAITDAAKNYLTTPVHISLPITKLQSNQLGVRDEVTVAIAETGHCSTIPDIVTIRTKVVNGARKVQDVQVQEGNATIDVPVLRAADDVLMVVDTMYGDAAILRVNDATGRMVILNGMTDILPRLKLVVGLPEAPEDKAIGWEIFSKDYDPYHGFEEDEDGDEDEGGNGDEDENGDGDGDGE